MRGQLRIVVDGLLGRSTAGERRALRRILTARPTAVLAGPESKTWQAVVRQAHADARFIFPDERELANLDGLLGRAGIAHVHLLHARPAALLQVLMGAERTLSHARIDVIVSPRAGPVSAAVAERLSRSGYEMLLPASARSGARLFAMHQRLLPLAIRGPKRMLDLDMLCRQWSIVPRGVVHLGANEGQEAQGYRRMGIEQMLFVEANPAVFARLSAGLGGEPGIALACCAIASQPGTAVLHVTSWDQCSSLLPLSAAREYYPQVVEERTIAVPAKTVDGLMDELRLSPERFNLLNIDIQGSELAALEGAERLLPHIEGINVEVYFEELYGGCSQIEDTDRFLEVRGFRRVATTSPFHPSWGDAFYVRSR